MTTWSDSRVVSGTVASTAETQVGSDINVPQNQTYLVTGVYFTHPQGGTGRMAIDSLSGLNGTYIQNSNDPLQLASGEGSAAAYGQNFVVQGPAVIQLYVTNAAATSGTAKAMINYQVTQRNTVGG